MILAALSLNDPSQSATLELGEGDCVVLGRRPEPREGASSLRIPWPDRIVSRTHALLRRSGDDLVMERLPPLPGRSKPNPFCELAPRGHRRRKRDPVTLHPGDGVFVGNRGGTALIWLRESRELSSWRDRLRRLQEAVQTPAGEDSPLPQGGDAAGHLEELDDYSVRFQLRLLQQELPEKVLRDWNTGPELMTKAADFLKAALAGQRRVSVAFLAFEAPHHTEYVILNQDPSGLADFRIHPRLIDRMNRDQPRPEDRYLWTSSPGERGTLTDSSILDDSAWILVLPIASMGGEREVLRDESGRPVFLYVSAQTSEGPSASSLVPFVRLISSLVASLLSAREKQRIQDKLSAHFSPAVRGLLHAGDARALRPTLAECTVLFCDRRGASSLMEQASTDEEILSQLHENQVVMTEITSTVFDHDGVITDFAGDGVLALWGWPMPSSNHALQAANAAQSIAERLAFYVEELPGGRRLAGIRMGISTGRIAVGNTGPFQQVHLSVFGSVVNFGARLEALGKQFRVPALISDTTCQLMRDSGKLVRKLCYLRPAGFQRSYPVYEMVLPRRVGGSGASADQIEIYETALDHFIRRNWQETIELLSQLPAHDEPAHWLEQQASFLSRHDPGDEWQGEILSEVK